MTLVATPAGLPAPVSAHDVERTQPAGGSPGRLRSAPRAVAIVAVVVVLVISGVIGHKVVGHSVLAVIRQLRWGWVCAAVAAQVLSIVGLAWMQRRLLRVGGLRLSTRSALAVVCASNAISGSVPLAGSELGTAYTFRQYQRRGAGHMTAAWVLAVAGVISSVTFALIVAVSAAASGNTAATIAGLTGTVALVGSIALVSLAVRVPPLRHRLISLTVAALRTLQRVVRRPRGDPAVLVDSALRQFVALRLRRLDWTSVVGAASLNWMADIFCLVLAITALGQHVPWALLIPAWAAGATASSVSVTPGGLGVVEAALVAALVAAGLHSSAAVGSVLVYRSITFWFALAVGWCVYLGQRHHDHRQKLDATMAAGARIPEPSVGPSDPKGTVGPEGNRRRLALTVR